MTQNELNTALASIDIAGDLEKGFIEDKISTMGKEFSNLQGTVLEDFASLLDVINNSDVKIEHNKLFKGAILDKLGARNVSELQRTLTHTPEELIKALNKYKDGLNKILFGDGDILLTDNVNLKQLYVIALFNKISTIVYLYDRFIIVLTELCILATEGVDQPLEAVNRIKNKFDHVGPQYINLFLNTLNFMKQVKEIGAEKVLKTIDDFDPAIKVNKVNGELFDSIINGMNDKTVLKEFGTVKHSFTYNPFFFLINLYHDFQSFITDAREDYRRYLVGRVKETSVRLQKETLTENERENLLKLIEDSKTRIMKTDTELEIYKKNLKV